MNLREDISVDTTKYEITKRACVVMNAAFDNEYDLDVFYNKHFGNPNRVTNPVEIVTEDGTDAGVGCFLGMKLYNNDKNSSDKHIYTVTQNCELCVHPDFQGRGIFHRIIDERELNDTESSFICGLPNEKSFPAFMKTGYNNCGDITRYRLYPHSKLSFLKKLFRKLLGQKAKINKIENAVNVKELNTFFTEKEYEEINSEGVRFERSNDLFNWLFTYKKHEYLLKDYDKNGNLMSYIIFRHDFCPLGTVIAIDDWYSKNNNPAYFNKILKIISKYCDMVEVYTVNEKVDGQFMVAAGLTNIKKYEKTFKDRPLISSKNGKAFPWFDMVSLRNIDDDYFFYE